MGGGESGRRSGGVARQAAWRARSARKRAQRARGGAQARAPVWEELAESLWVHVAAVILVET